MNELLRNKENNMSGRIIRIIDMKILEKNIPNYILWLKKNKRVDRIVNYKEFLQV